MSVRTRTAEAPGRIARRVQAAERVKSGAAQRAYAKRRLRAEQSGDHQELPRQRTSVMASRIPFVAAIIALLGCGLALTLLLTTRSAEDSYQLGDARATNRKLADERSALQREVEAADSAPALAARARELGMIPAKDPARIVVAPDGAVTVIGKPTPAEGAPVPPLNVSPSAPVVPQSGNAQARGERVVPVPTTTPPAPAPARPGAGQPANAVAGQASPQPSPVPSSPVPTPVPSPAAQAPVETPQPETPQPEAPQQASQPEAVQPEAPQPQTTPDGATR
jgi:cell division protein FtsB